MVVKTKNSYSIFDEESIRKDSKLFGIPKDADQITLTAFGLADDDCIHIHMVVLSEGEFGSVCGCYYTPAVGGEIIANEPVTCINDLGRVVTLKITAENPVVVLTRPQLTVLRAEYHNINGVDNLGHFTVIVTTNTHVNRPECSTLAGCIEGCEEYIPTYAFPDCGIGFAPTDKKDPKATVELVSCFGKIIAYIYPKQYRFAQLPIRSCTGELLGYAIQGQSPDCRGHYTCIS